MENSLDSEITFPSGEQGVDNTVLVSDTTHSKSEQVHSERQVGDFVDMPHLMSPEGIVQQGVKHLSGTIPFSLGGVSGGMNSALNTITARGGNM